MTYIVNFQEINNIYHCNRLQNCLCHIVFYSIQIKINFVLHVSQIASQFIVRHILGRAFAKINFYCSFNAKPQLLMGCLCLYSCHSSLSDFVAFRICVHIILIVINWYVDEVLTRHSFVFPVACLYGNSKCLARH